MPMIEVNLQCPKRAMPAGVDPKRILQGAPKRRRFRNMLHSYALRLAGGAILGIWSK